MSEEPLPSSRVPAEPVSGDGFPASEWLLAEYSALSEHYFHEDKLFMNVTNIFSTLNGVLLVLTIGKDAAPPAGLEVAVPVFGVVLCLTWWASLYRIRRWRRNLEERLRELESDVRPLLVPQVPHALRLRRDGSAKTPLYLQEMEGRLGRPKWTDRLATTKMLLALPLAIAAIWTYVGVVLATS